MSQTRPKSEQVEFRSARTGSHSLDDYLEAAELGGRRLADLLNDIFLASTGAIRTDVFEFRVNPATHRLQVRIGLHIEPDAAWQDVPQGTFFRPAGDWATGTSYVRHDVISFNDILYLATEDHTSTGIAPDPTKTMVLLDRSQTNPIIAELEAQITALEDEALLNLGVA